MYEYAYQNTLIHMHMNRSASFKDSVQQDDIIRINLDGGQQLMSELLQTAIRKTDR